MTGAEVAVASALAPELLGAAAGAGIAGGATAAGLGAAGASALGAGMGGGTAALFGPAALGAASTPLATSLMAPAVAPAATLGAGMGGGTAALFGPQALGGMGAPGMGTAASGFPWQKMAGHMGKNMLEDEQQQPAPAGQRPQSNATTMDSAEIMKRLRMAGGQRSNWGGLLGQAIGR